MLHSPSIGPPHFLGTVGGFPPRPLNFLLPSSVELLVAGQFPSWVVRAISVVSIAVSPVPSALFTQIAVHVYGARRAGLVQALFVRVLNFCSSLSVPLPHFLALRLACLCDSSVSGWASCVVALWVLVPSVPSWRHRCLLPSWLATADQDDRAFTVQGSCTGIVLCPHSSAILFSTLFCLPVYLPS